MTKNKSEINEIDNILLGYKTEAQMNETLQVDEQEPVKVETRGRKKGSKFKKEPDQQTAAKDITGGELISGAIFLLFIDLAIPNLLCIGYNAINKKKKKKLSPKSMQLTSSQRSELEPLANEASKQLLIHASPLTVFLVALAGIYGMNFAMLTASNE